MLSVVLPSYNEEEMVPVAARTVHEILAAEGIDHELLFVDDGLDAKAQIAVAMLLRGQSEAYLCAKSQIGDFLQWERENFGAGTD